MENEKIYQKITRHQDFWDMREVDNPLVGFCLGGWSQFQQYPSLKKLIPGEIKPEMLKVDNFIEDYKNVLNFSNIAEDDLLRSAEPIPAIPWMEAIIGCPIEYSDNHIWANKTASIQEIKKISYSDDNPWVAKYIEFLSKLTEVFADQHPIAQPILRGPSDMLSAILGEVDFIYALIDEPDKVNKLMKQCKEVLANLALDHYNHVPKYNGGYILGQYYIWAPGKCIRFQEDAMSLLSPKLYEEFVYYIDQELANLVNYSLMHIHESSLFLIDYIVNIENLRAIQIAKDPNGMPIKDFIKYLKMIQEKGKCLIVKGAFTENELFLLRNNLSLRGLSIQPIVTELERVKEFKKILYK